jgi:hypothetical protein
MNRQRLALREVAFGNALSIFGSVERRSLETSAVSSPRLAIVACLSRLFYQNGRLKESA